MKNYVMYHCHSDDSLLDSCTKFTEYVDLAVKNGQPAIASTEHGRPMSWVSKKIYCDKAGIKFIYGAEIYLTERLTPKVRDNYHTVLLAKNLDGIKELNRLISLSFDDAHFYYTNRVTFDEFLAISDNIISTSACLASPLNKLSDDHPAYMKLANKYDFFEIQGHAHPEQIGFNKRLLKLSLKLKKPLIAGTDTHSSTPYKAECRRVLISAKGKNYSDEDAFDLTYKTYNELVEMFNAQMAIPAENYLQAIENTNLLNDMVEDVVLDTQIKYPILYGSREEDSRAFIEKIMEKFSQKLKNGIIPPEQESAFRLAIDEEIRVFKKLNMDGFMLSMSELLSWGKERGMSFGTARGSVGGSRVAYIMDIIDLNPETWKTVFSRFCNEDRIEIGDIDIDCVDADRPAIFEYITKRFGAQKTARVAAFGTIQAKKAIEDIGRHLARVWATTHADSASNPWSIPNISRIKKEFEESPEQTKRKYQELFYYFDGLIDVRCSQSVHPAGMVISPVTLDDNYGVFSKDGETCLFLDMGEAHEVGLAKYDFLILKTVDVIKDTCMFLGKQYPHTHEINWDDKAVWDSMITSPSGIFQFEGAFAFNCLKQFKPKSIFDMSLVTASIRPSGASYRDRLLNRTENKNPSDLIDELLQENLGYLIYQEDTIKFLQEICGLTGSEADNVRRAIGRKQKDRLEKALPSILEGYCVKSPHPREVAEAEAKEFIQVIEDSANYQFGYNHSIAYCLLGYLCAYYRHYYPFEFLTSFLNNAANDSDIISGTNYAKDIGITITNPKWGVSKGEYFFDKQRNIIAKGLTSIKYMNLRLADELFRMSRDATYSSFMKLLEDMDKSTCIDSRQLDILIKLDFFSDFGNQRELLRMVDLFANTFKKGDAKKIKKTDVDGTPLEEIVKRYAVGMTKSGGVAKSYTLLDVTSILEEAEVAVKAIGMEDLSDILKVRNFYDVMGYIGYTSGKDEDRRKLYVTEVKPLHRKSDNKRFGYSVFTKSIGSGKESRFTVFSKVYDADPIKEGDIIYCQEYLRDGQYFKLTNYYKIL